MSVSSQTSRTGASAGTSTATIRSSRTRPSWSADQRAWEKKRWARLWCQACSRWPPCSMPVTVCSPGWAQNPQASPMKVAKVGVVKQPRKRSSRQVREAGRLRVSIGGDLVVGDLWGAADACLPLARKQLSQPRHHYKQNCESLAGVLSPPELPPVLQRPDYLVPAVVACFRLR